MRPDGLVGIYFAIFSLRIGSGCMFKKSKVCCAIATVRRPISLCIDAQLQSQTCSADWQGLASVTSAVREEPLRTAYIGVCQVPAGSNTGDNVAFTRHSTPSEDGGSDSGCRCPAFSQR